MSTPTQPTGNLPLDIATTPAEAITSRHSVRSFTADAVTRETVQHILDVARYAPSGTNTQPWHVYVTAGDAKKALSTAILAHYWNDNAEPTTREYNYYPSRLEEPYLARKRACGWGLYGALNIQRGEKDKMRHQRARNFSFFDAPVGLFFAIDRDLSRGSWLDLGMFLQNVMVAARGEGLHTCPQAAFADYHQIIRRHVPIPATEIVVCGMALGFRKPDAPENIWRTEREATDTFTQWLGFND